MKTLILVNPKAREGRVGDRWPELERQLLGALGDGEAKVAFTSAEDHGSGAVRAALRSGVRSIVVVGGDGTISEAVQGFFDGTDSAGAPRAVAPDAELKVMPAGRGDDFFKSMTGRRQSSSDKAWEEGLRILREGAARPVDIGSLSWRDSGGAPSAPRYFVNIASFGYPGLVVQRVLSHAGLWGRSRAGKSAWTYLLQSAAGLLEYKPLEMEVTVDGRALYGGPVFSGFVLNGSYNAGGVRWSDEARIDDGVFHVVVMEPRDLGATVLSAPRMLSGKWAEARGADLASGKRVEVRLKAGLAKPHPLFEIDGDQPESPGTLGASFEVLPAAIRLRVSNF